MRTEKLVMAVASKRPSVEERHVLPQSCLTVARHAPRKLPQAILASSEVVRQLPNSCRTVAQAADIQPNFGQALPS